MKNVKSAEKRRIQWLNSAAKTQIPRLGAKFRRPRKTVGPINHRPRSVSRSLFIHDHHTASLLSSEFSPWHDSHHEDFLCFTMGPPPYWLCSFLNETLPHSFHSALRLTPSEVQGLKQIFTHLNDSPTSFLKQLDDIVGHGGALVEAITLNRRVVGSTPALAAM